jgi:hypothetical protein
MRMLVATVAATLAIIVSLASANEDNNTEGPSATRNVATATPAAATSNTSSTNAPRVFVPPPRMPPPPPRMPPTSSSQSQRPAAPRLSQPEYFAPAAMAAADSMYGASPVHRPGNRSGNVLADVLSAQARHQARVDTAPPASEVPTRAEIERTIEELYSRVQTAVQGWMYTPLRG